MCLLGVQGPGVHTLGGGAWGDPQGLGAGAALLAALTLLADRHQVKTVVNAGVRP